MYVKHKGRLKTMFNPAAAILMDMIRRENEKREQEDEEVEKEENEI